MSIYETGVLEATKQLNEYIEAANNQGQTAVIEPFNQIKSSLQKTLASLKNTFQLKEKLNKKS